jgi:hypothetical protein
MSRLLRGSWERRFALLASLFLALLAGVGLSVRPASAASLTEPVLGVLSDGGTFSGNFVLKSLGVQKFGDGEVLYAVGVLKGTAKTSDGASHDVTQSIKIPIDLSSLDPSIKRVCQVLSLNIGRINLDLLGLVVDLSPIELNITAIPGGGLLGNLLCGLSRLLSGIPTLDDLLNQINKINSALSGA